MRHPITKLAAYLITFCMLTPFAQAEEAANDPVQASYAEQTTILALGDSLVAGYGLPPGESFPDKLQDALADTGNQVEMINAGVSGDTTAGGLARLGWVLSDNIDLLIITLGGNDVLRGLPPEESKRNLTAIIEQARNSDPDIKILLTGMQSPPNLGDDYAASFNPIYQQLADKYDLALYPFFLDGVAADPALNQNDGIHPNEKGVAVIVGKILPYVQAALAP